MNLVHYKNCFKINHLQTETVLELKRFILRSYLVALFDGRHPEELQSVCRQFLSRNHRILSTVANLPVS